MPLTFYVNWRMLKNSSILITAVSISKIHYLLERVTSLILY